MQSALSELVSACPGASTARTVAAGDDQIGGTLQFLAVAALDLGEAAAEGTETGDAYAVLVDTSGNHRVEGAAIQKMLSIASAWKSADIHMSTALDLSDGKRYLTVRLERLGELVAHDKLPGEAGDRIMARIRAISKMKHDEVRPQDAAVTIVDPITKARPRDSHRRGPARRRQPDDDAEAAAAGAPDLSTLDTLFPSDVTPVPAEVLKASLHRPDGLTLVTGPTSEGKSTTLAAIINEIADPSLKIVTAEGAGRVPLPLADQVPDRHERRLWLPRSDRGVPALCPKIIMIGEIRNEATASAAMRAAETGHRVLSTLHVKSAAAAITRLRGLKIGVDVISSSLNLIVAQRLLRTLCGACDQNNPAARCATAQDGGGRAAVMEALLIDDNVVELLASPVPPTLAAIRKHQYFKFADHAKALVESGRTTAEEAARVLGPAAGYDLDPA